MKPELTGNGHWDRPMHELVELLLVEEMGYTPEDAARMCKEHTNVMVNGLMDSRHPRPIAMAIEMAENAKAER